MGVRLKKTIKVTFPDGRVEKFTSLVDLANQYFDIKKLNYFYNRTQYKGFPFMYRGHKIEQADKGNGKYKGETYELGNQRHNLVELYQDGVLKKIVDIKYVTKIKSL